jgi:CRISPR type III-A-associated RAMP protein Csm4
MNPGLVVKLRPTGPWRIGSDAGARNRVDAVYHSDSLYSAACSAMALLGRLEEWLEATARSDGFPAVCFSSCFPFLEEIDFIVPPRTVWPPASPGLSGRVRWKSAHFVPLDLVRELLLGRRIEESLWSVDGPSECLTPAGLPGPFRTSVRHAAAVDRLTGAAERHSSACVEFRAGGGLWTVASFADEAARDRWREPVKAAFRLLADSGFGGERSRGWGRSEPPEFIEGDLPEMILPAAPAPPDAGLTIEERLDRLVADLVGSDATMDSSAGPRSDTNSEAITEPGAKEATGGSPADQGVRPTDEPEAIDAGSGASEEAAVVTGGSVAVLEMEEAPDTMAEPERQEPEPEPQVAATLDEGSHPHWLLSLFTPAPGDTVDWSRGNYAVVNRGGRVESPVGSGGLKKQAPMVAEGSVLVAASGLRGSAADVAPDGFPHPVYRAGFAVAIPLPEVR